MEMKNVIMWDSEILGKLLYCSLFLTPHPYNNRVSLMVNNGNSQLLLYVRIAC